MKLNEMAKTIIETMDEVGYTKAGAREAVKALFEDMLNELREEGKTRVPGIGTVILKKMPKRKARNPKTGETIIVPERYALRMKFSPKLKREVKEMKPKSDKKTEKVKKSKK